MEPISSVVRDRLCPRVSVNSMPRLVEAVATFVLNGAICTKLLYKLCLIFYNGDM